jgi:hypothetical protein
MNIENKRIKLKVAEKTEKKEGIAICPLCGSKLERGYVASKAVAWSDKKISNWSLKGLFGGEMIVSRGYPYPVTNVEAYRCRKCKLIVFEY